LEDNGLLELFYVILAFGVFVFVAVYAHYDFLKKLLKEYEKEKGKGDE